jgi:putative ABC transport system permease protein
MGSGNGTWMWNRRTAFRRRRSARCRPPDGALQSLYVRLKDAVAVRRSLASIATVVEDTLLRRRHGVKNFEVESDARAKFRTS